MIEDVKTLFQLVKQTKGENHRQRIENFYENQSENYDRFRQKLLAGRRNMYQQLVEQQPSGIWIDFGSGTGAILDYLSDEQIKQYDTIYLVDIAQSLLDIAKAKIDDRDLSNVKVVTSEILTFQPHEFSDVVTFSYSLTMTPQWYKALDHSYQLMTPQAKIGVVDFYVAEKHPMPGLESHAAATRHFWPLWFAYDNVFLNPDHLPYLINKFEKVSLYEGQNPIPMLPLGKVPYYSFIGKKS